MPPQRHFATAPLRRRDTSCRPMLTDAALSLGERASASQVVQSRANECRHSANA